jgi:hypothetical protein
MRHIGLIALSIIVGVFIGFIEVSYLMPRTKLILEVIALCTILGFSVATFAEPLLKGIWSGMLVIFCMSSVLLTNIDQYILVQPRFDSIFTRTDASEIVSKVIILGSLPLAAGIGLILGLLSWSLKLGISYYKRIHTRS